MRVLLLGDDPIFAQDISWGFKELGHTVMVKMPDSENDFALIMASFEPELIITFGSPSYYQNKSFVEMLAQRKRYCNAKYVHWDTDGITWAHLELHLIKRTGPDLVFTICPDMFAVLEKEQIASEMLPYAFSPLVHHPATPNIDFKGQIVFVGCAYPEVVCNNPNHFRTKSIETLIKPLLQNGIRVDFWGDPRHRYVMKQSFDCIVQEDWLHGRCPYENTHEIYSSCFINIVPQNHNSHLTKRTYEILGSGGFILTYNSAEVRRLFTPNKEMAVSDNPKLTLELVDYYKNNAFAYNEVRKNALIASQSHSYKQRAEQIIKSIS